MVLNRSQEAAFPQCRLSLLNNAARLCMNLIVYMNLWFTVKSNVFSNGTNVASLIFQRVEFSDSDVKSQSVHVNIYVMS